MKKTRLYWDVEFTGLHKNTTIVSIGIVSECGKTFYAEFLDYDKSQVDEWLQENVIDNLLFTDKITAAIGSWEHWINDNGKYGNALEMALAERDGKADMSQFECIGKTPMIKNRLERWLAQFDAVEMWGDVLAYDWVLFCDIFGGAFNIPKNAFYIPFDISSLLKDKGIDPDINREEFVGEEIIKIICGNLTTTSITKTVKSLKHNSLYDAYITRACHEEIKTS